MTKFLLSAITAICVLATNTPEPSKETAFNIQGNTVLVAKAGESGV
jgi:hypothetical protein